MLKSPNGFLQKSNAERNQPAPILKPSESKSLCSAVYLIRTNCGRLQMNRSLSSVCRAFSQCLEGPVCLQWLCPLWPVQHSLCLVTGSCGEVPTGLLRVAEPLQLQKVPPKEPLATPMLRYKPCLVSSFLLTYSASIRTVQLGGRDRDLGSHKPD